MKGGLQSDAPRPQVIIPSAAYGGGYQLLIMPIRASKSKSLVAFIYGSAVSFLLLPPVALW